MRFPHGSWTLGAAVAAVIAAMIAGLIVLGSPGAERARRLDAQRVEDLQAIAAATDLYWTRHSQLPTSLDELTAEPGVSISTADPASTETYEYRALDDSRYEVCATFALESEQIAEDPARNFWVHASGRQCFELEAKEIEHRESGRIPAQEAGENSASPRQR